MKKNISFQGELGAYSHEACRQARPDWNYLPSISFEDAISAVLNNKSEEVMLPVENSIYGRVADIHKLLPESGLFINDEVFVKIEINLMVLPGTSLEEVKYAYSHPVLLGQCKKFLKQNDIIPLTSVDTSGSARLVAEKQDPSYAALASNLASQIFKLQIIQKNIEDAHFNRTRFIIMSKNRKWERRSESMMTSFVFAVRNIPASLYKAMGGFATNNVNMVKLESYMVGGSFNATQFFAEIEGHPEDEGVVLALEELKFFTDYLEIIGVYPAHKARLEVNSKS
ncbi:MAG: prephenate dehydratase [Rhodobacteraceae bacterium]|nr:prephenate dehydratase [Paracoccaceae bacterium]